ncbi:P4R3B phosphatase, partial [Hirundo rustica]|nr:P4R3B phosphatase [Hirundo rustica]
SEFLDLPTCELDSLQELAALVTAVRISPVPKEWLAMILKHEGYIPKLLQLFQVCESEKNIEGLHLLFEVVRAILYLDKAFLFEEMLSEEHIMDVVGCLEYDPCLDHPVRHREFLTKITKLHDAILIRDPELRKKIRQTFGAQYIQAIIMHDPSDFEEGFLSTFNSFISSSRKEILFGLLKDEDFLPGILAQLKNEATDGVERREMMMFFKQFCTSSFMLPEKRDEFIQTLQKLGFLPILEKSMGMDDLQIRSAATDMLFYLVLFSPDTVQEFVMQEARQSENDGQLITKIIEQIICNPDPEFGECTRLMEIFCALIDPEKMMDVFSHLEVFEFVNTFYNRYIDVLTAPLMDDTSEEWNEIVFFFFFFFFVDNYRTAEILASVLELLSFCVERHEYHMKAYVIKKDLLRRALVLMKSKHKFLALCALRFMRGIIGLKDDLYNNYITTGNLFEPVVNAVLANKSSCNLLRSALMELFEFIQEEDIHFLIEHIVENFSDALESLKCLPTFQGLKTKYEQEKERQNKELD